MKKLVLTIAALSLASNIAFADQPQSIYLDQGKPAPFPGYLLPPPTVKDLYNQSLELGEQKTENGLKDTEIKLLTADNARLEKANASASGTSTLEKVAYFALGCLATYGAVRIGVQINNH